MVFTFGMWIEFITMFLFCEMQYCPGRVLYVYAYCQIPIVFYDTCVTDQKLTYASFLQDVHVKRKYNMSYVEHMQGFIDNLIHQQDKKCTNEQSNYTTVMNSASSDILPSGSIVQPRLLPLISMNCQLSLNKISMTKIRSLGF